MKRMSLSLGGCLLIALAGMGCGKAEEGGSDDKKPDESKPADKPAADKKPAAKMAPPAKKEKGPPPPEIYEGMGRVVNLAMKDGKPVAVDVWAKRSFKYGPVKLVENVAFGEASKWHRSPKGMSVSVFEAGKGPDDKEAELGGLFHAKKGEHITGIFYNGKDGKPTNGNYWETSDDATKRDTPDSPEAGKGYVIFRAGQLRAHEEAMKEVTGGWAMRVGDGKGNCLPQRVETMGFQAALLGGTQPVEVDLAPGKHKITFHKGMKKGCAEAEKVYELELDVKADTSTLVALYTPDAKVLKHGVYKMAVNTAKPYGTNKKMKEERDAKKGK